MPDVGVVVALPREAATWGIKPPRTGASIRCGVLRIMVCGIGAERARRAAGSLLDAGVRELVSWGIAGGLAAALSPGDIVVAARAGSTDGVTPSDVGRVERVVRMLRDSGVTARVGALWTDTTVITDISHKQRLAMRGYDVVDMEAAGVARMARTAGVPFLAIKAVSDPAARALPEAAGTWLRPDGRLRPAALARALARGPRMWRAMRGMQADFNAACAGLYQAAEPLRRSWPT